MLVKNQIQTCSTLLTPPTGILTTQTDRDFWSTNSINILAQTALRYVQYDGSMKTFTPQYRSETPKKPAILRLFSPIFGHCGSFYTHKLLVRITYFLVLRWHQLVQFHHLRQQHASRIF